jgi:Tfp pilus assembly protein PilF
MRRSNDSETLGRFAAYCALAALVAFAIACGARLPDRSSAAFEEAIKSFYVGLAAMQAADDVRARKEIENFLRLAPDEPAGWANMGVLQMRQRDYDESFRSFEKARSLAPDNGAILSNFAVLEIQRGKFVEARALLESAIEVDPKDTRSMVALAEELERNGDDDAALAGYERILRVYPGNTPVLIEIIRLSAKRGDGEKLRSSFQGIKLSPGAEDPEISAQYRSLGESVSAGNSRDVSQRIAFFRNVLLRLPEFRAEIERVNFNKTTVGVPLGRPLRLSTPEFSPAARDNGLTFAPETISSVQAKFVKPLFLDGDSAPSVSFGDRESVTGGNLKIAPTASDIATLDVDYDFRNDFVTAGPVGLRFTNADGTDITGATKLPQTVIGRGYQRIYTFDVEIDGDLDLLLIGTDERPVVLRNNADGTFRESSPFPELSRVTGFAAVDLDEDGDADAAFVAGSKLVLFTNERGGDYTPRGHETDAVVAGLTAGDSDSDGRLDLAVLQADGMLLRLQEEGSGALRAQKLVLADASVRGSPLIADLDNNGASDLVVGDRFWLADADRSYAEPAVRIGGRISGVADLNGDGRLDLVGTDPNGNPAKFINRGTKSYGWQVFRPRSAKSDGDQRVNSFGIGGEMEIRSGLLAQKRIIDSPQVHFGLGEQGSTDLLRVIWGNGFVQAEFDLEKDQPIVVKQRLTGSCPHLFAWDGSQFSLVKDAAPLATSLGLRTADTQVHPVTQTEEWYKIDGDRLVPRDGFYELRITDELWESYYVDGYRLIVVDHPIGTEVFANELYPVPEPLELHATSRLRALETVVDDKGNNVAAKVAALDRVHFDTFDKGRFQGLAEEHFIEFSLPADAPSDRSLKILADGWLHPTDTSLNVAIGQSGYAQPKSLSLEVFDTHGKWVTALREFGVPAGKLKTIVMNLPKGIRRARIRTNMEVFWDRLAWAESVGDSDFRYRALDIARAELAFRGYSVIDKQSDSSPEMPDYNRVATTIERWRSIEGYYTRYGAIDDLVRASDDRYAIVASGDEMKLWFPELPPPPPGFRRDFVFAGVGWIKEGDYNNLFSKTVLPLPTHVTNGYTRRPGRLEDDPVYQRNRRDWLDFHTRYVAPDRFRSALRSK